VNGRSETADRALYEEFRKIDNENARIDQEQRSLIAHYFNLAVAAAIKWGGEDRGLVELEYMLDNERRNRIQPVEPPARKKKQPVSGILRKFVFERDEYRCRICKNHHSLSIDHIIPESKDGSTTADNLQTLCMPCNAAKGVK